VQRPPLSLAELVILRVDEPREQIAQLLEWAAVQQAEAELNGHDAGLLTRTDTGAAPAAQDTSKPSGESSGTPTGVDGPTTKRCRTCQQDLPVAEFDRNRGSCKECRRRQARERKRRAAASAGDPEG
jgi:hypothetical protein